MLSVGIEIRPARAEDQARINDLVRSARLNPLRLDWNNFVVAEEQDGEVVACGQIRTHRDGTQELASIVVDEGWRGRGLARAVIERLMDRAGRPLWLMCRSGLAPLYDRFGFEEVGPQDDQPTYFRRVRGLASVYHLLAGTGEHLSIMVCRPPDPRQSAGA